MNIDRCELANKKGCRDTSYLEGLICTNRCEFRNSCEIKRIPLLIQAQTSTVLIKNEDEIIRKIICCSDILTDSIMDEYIIGGQERKI